VPYLLHPVAEEVYHEFFASVRAGLVVELSHQGQLYRLLRMFVDVPAGMRQMTSSGANPFLPVAIANKLTKAALGLQRQVSDLLPVEA
jgi:hypothetical protein